MGKNDLNDFSVEINDPEFNFHIRLDGFNNVLAFVQNELNFWKRAHNQRNFVSALNGHWQNLLTQISGLEQIRLNTTNDDFNNRCNNIKSELCKIRLPNNIRILFSQTAEAKFIMTLLERNFIEGDGGYDYMCGKIIRSQDKNYHVGWLKAYEFDEQEDSKIIKRRNIEKKVLSELRNEWNQTTKDLKRSFEIQTKEVEDWKNQIIQDHESWHVNQEKQITSLIDEKKATLKELEDIYTKKLQLEGPVKYWKARVQDYSRKSLIWILLLSLSLIIIASVLIGILYNLPNALTKSIFTGEPEAIKGLLILAAIISFGAYLVRVFSKLAFSSLHLKRDSEEREQLTMVYLALKKEGAITNEERNLVLESLFSRAETGLLRRDSSPEMPGFSNILEKFSSKL